MSETFFGIGQRIFSADSPRMPLVDSSIFLYVFFLQILTRAQSGNPSRNPSWITAGFHVIELKDSQDDLHKDLQKELLKDP